MKSQRAFHLMAASDIVSKVKSKFIHLIAGLIRAERTHRQAIGYRIRGAKFPMLKDLDKFIFASTPVDAGQLREPAAGAFLDAKRNAIFPGGTGTGKTHPCIAAAPTVVRARARGRFFNLADLVNQLDQEKDAGRGGRLAGKLPRYDLIVSTSSAIRRSAGPAVPPDRQAP